MEEELTQPGNEPTSLSFHPKAPLTDADDPYFVATQLVIDPRRHGHQNSGLSDEDLTDIFCILHPASMPACLATVKIAQDCPEHTISTTGVEIKLRGSNNGTANPPNSLDLVAKGVASRDIALRFSADLKQPLLGYCFGRNYQRCDFIIGNTEGAKRISNVHFRVYITEHGVIMIEDQSTNGTQVENVMLRAKEKENGHQYKHTLQQGSLITLIMTPPEEDIKFVVRIPHREGEYEEAYEHNLRNYFQRLRYRSQLREVEKAAAIAAGGGPKSPVPGNEGPPDIFGPMTTRAPSFSESDIGSHVKEWKGGLKYNKVRVIGKGAFATVYLLTAKFDGTCFAAKEVEKRRFMKNGILDQKVDMEMKIMRKIHHPHIVQYIEDVDFDNYLYLIMDYVPHGDLGTLISKQEKLAEDTVKALASQLLSALKYLHKMGVTHRDVKPDNILIHKHHPLHVKLTDFGLSKMVEDDDETFLRTFCGTLLYCAPEVYTEYREYDSKGNRTQRGKDKKSSHQPRYDQAVDLWSLGSVLFYTLCGNPPYPAKSGTGYQELLKQIMTKPLDIRPLQHAGVTDAGVRFVRSLLQVQPERRPPIEQLETSPWLEDISPVTSVDEDEVDMIREGDGEILEEGASQLSIHGQNDYDLDSDMIQDVVQNTQNTPQFAAGIQQGISSSLNSSDSALSESFAFMRNPPGNARLFGEVNASALGSSGVIPEEHLNLPVSIPVSENGNLDIGSNLNVSSTSIDTRSELHAMEGVELTQGTPNVSNLTTEHDFEESHNLEAAVSAPSLLGAESMVGQMQMNSPSPFTGGPATETATPEGLDSMTTSLRRPRDETGNGEDARPAPKRVKSSREIDIPISKTVFWDDKNKETWHHDYPNMMLSQYAEAVDLAQAHGEKFVHGEKIFDMYVGSFRKTPSVEPNTKPRAQSEPTIEQGRKAMMRRDDRKLEDMTDTELPSTSRGQSMTMTGLNTAQQADQARRAEAIQSANKDATFKPPRRILAKFLATSDSVLPSVNLTINEPFTSWGRGYTNTVVYVNGYEDRIPKFAFKLALWKRGVSPTDTQPPQLDRSFWVSTKATMGIVINGVLLKSYDIKHPHSPSKEWGELRHGDEVIIWSKENKLNLFIKLRFECYFGASQTRRAAGDPPFTPLATGEVSEELDRYCMQVEDNIKDAAAKAKAKREEQEAKDKQKEDKEKEDKEKEDKDRQNRVQTISRGLLPTV